MFVTLKAGGTCIPIVQQPIELHPKIFYPWDYADEP